MTGNPDKSLTIDTHHHIYPPRYVTANLRRIVEDSFALPPLEAMACGLPVITSVNNGGSQIITEGVDGFVLSDPRDTIALSMLLRRLYQDRDLCALIGENSARTAQGYTWERNARETWGVLMAAMAKKGQPAASRENI